MGNIESFILKNGIRMEAEKVRSNPVPPGKGLPRGLKHYRCLLSGAGKHTELYVSVDHGGGIPALKTVLYMLALDAHCCSLLNGFETFEKEIRSTFGDTSDNPDGMKALEEFSLEYWNRFKQVERVRGFLGESAYRELIECVPFQISDC